MAYKKEVIEKAKELYLELDESGSRKYGLKSIAKILNEKFNLKINHTTIRIWRDKERWDDLLRQKMTIAISEELKKEADKSINEISQEERIKEIISKAKTQPVVALIRLSNKLDKTIKEIDPKDKRFPRVAEVATKTFTALHELLSEIEEPSKKDEKPIIIINEINAKGEVNDSD